MGHGKGRTRRGHRINGKPLPLDLLLDLGVEISEGPEAAHANGIEHRDIKPANIFVTTHGHAKILDFGHAKQTAKPSSPSNATMTRDVAGPTVAEEQLTSPGTALGTVANMSPERARGEEVDARTDLFSFGAVLYEMATGAPAFQGDTTAGIFEMILHGAPADPVRLNQRVPAKLAEIIAKALEKDRRLSSQFAGEMRADLARLKRETDSTRNAITVTQPADAASAVSVGVIPPSGAAPADLTTPASGMTPAAPVPAAAARRHRIPVWIAAVAVVALAAIASVWYLWPRAPKLTSKDSIVLADFTNSSGRA